MTSSRFSRKEIDKLFSQFINAKLVAVPKKLQRWCETKADTGLFTNQWVGDRYMVIVGIITSYKGCIAERIFAVRKRTDHSSTSFEYEETGRRFFDRSHIAIKDLPYCGFCRGYVPQFRDYKWRRQCAYQITSRCIPWSITPSYFCNQEEAIAKYGKYSAWDQYKGKLDLYEYLSIYQQFQGIEILVKKGWSFLVPWWRQLNPKGRDVASLLNIPKKYEQALIDGELTVMQIKSLHNYPFKDSAEAKDFLQYCRNSEYNIGNLNFKERIYLWKKKRENKISRWYVFETEYADYIEMAKNLNYPLDNSWYHFPSTYGKLKALHDRAAAETAERKAQEYAEQHKKERDEFMKAVKQYTDFEWKQGGLMIISAKEPSDLIREGSTLNHCVGSYVGRVSRGETMIFFVRHTDDPDTPYVTLELKGKTITQVYGKGDTLPKEDAASFVDEWQNHFGFNQTWHRERVYHIAEN